MNNESEFVSYVCDAIVAAYKKKIPDHDVKGVRATFDQGTGEIGIFAPKKVVEKVNNAYHEISLADARDLIPDVNAGEVLEIEVTPADFSEFGRVAAQTAKQLFTKLGGEAKAELIKREFEALKGACTTGMIERIEPSDNSGDNVIIYLGRVEGCLLPEGQKPHEIYNIGDRIRVCIAELRNADTNPTIIVSRIHPNLEKEEEELWREY